MYKQWENVINSFPPSCYHSPVPPLSSSSLYLADYCVSLATPAALLCWLVVKSMHLSLFLTPLLLLWQGLSCHASFTLAGCQISALTLHCPHSPVEMILELQHSCPAWAQWLVLCTYTPMSRSLAALAIAFPPWTVLVAMLSRSLPHQWLSLLLEPLLPLPLSLSGQLLSKNVLLCSISACHPPHWWQWNLVISRCWQRGSPTMTCQQLVIQEA
jgi:hypothetical protein